MLWFDDLAHTWSGGAGASGSYIGAQSINFATYLGGYFADNNLRVNRNQAPEISSLTIGVNADQLFDQTAPPQTLMAMSLRSRPASAGLTAPIPCSWKS